jgi:hypothetical protein
MLKTLGFVPLAMEERTEIWKRPSAPSGNNSGGQYHSNERRLLSHPKDNVETFGATFGAINIKIVLPIF